MQHRKRAFIPRVRLSGIALVVLMVAMPAIAAAAGANLQVRSKESLGKYVTDPNGMTLYLFEKDRQGSGSSTCYGACAAAWPPLLTDGKSAAGTSVDASKLSTIRRKDGSRQVTYGGWPLYYYAQDNQPGDTRGHDIMGFGAEWYAVAPDGGKAGEGH